MIRRDRTSMDVISDLDIERRRALDTTKCDITILSCIIAHLLRSCRSPHAMTSYFSFYCLQVPSNLEVSTCPSIRLCSTTDKGEKHIERTT